jgi:hypothetical protein
MMLRNQAIKMKNFQKNQQFIRKQPLINEPGHE